MRIVRARRPDDEKSARYRALRLLERRPHASRELARKLRERGFNSTVTRAVIARLEEVGLLNDAKFAEDFAGWKLAARPQGRRMLVAKLLARGVDRTMAEKAAVSAAEGRDEEELLGEAARRYLARHRGAMDARLVRKLQAYLMRQGFEPEEVFRFTRKYARRDDE